MKFSLKDLIEIIPLLEMITYTNPQLSLVGFWLDACTLNERWMRHPFRAVFRGFAKSGYRLKLPGLDSGFHIELSVRFLHAS